MAVTAIEQNNADIRHNWTLEEITSLFNLPFSDLLFRAQSTHRKHFNPNEIQISSLLSIKTGGCPEDCKYCPQSSYYQTGVKAEKLMDVKDVVLRAKKAKQAGATRFCMGAAWRSPKDRDIPVLVKMIKAVKGLGLETCVTAGMITKKQADQFKEAGLDYYNHNIDSSEEFYKKVISTRTFQDRLDTLENIRKSGMKTCCGGIIGMGEKQKDRAQMLQTLANLPEHPQSVPINLLVKVEGAPLTGVETPDIFDFIRTIAVARIMMPDSYVRLSAGREEMSDEVQALCFIAGANSVFYGETLLTQPNPSENEDNELFKRLGIKIKEENRNEQSGEERISATS